MQVDEGMRKQLVNNLREYFEEFAGKVEELIDRMEGAETVERVMELKRDLLVMWVDYIPLGAGHCYFCLGEWDCSECEYARHHGECAIDRHRRDELEMELWDCIGRVEVDDYTAIRAVEIVLKRAIRELYYSGEEYEESR